jgi:hypothetical protein
MSRPTVPIIPPSSPPFAPSVGSVIGVAALFLFACVPYFFMMLDISNMRCCDPDNSGGLSQYFSRIGHEYGGLLDLFFKFGVILLWILLGCLLIPPVVRRDSSGHAAWWETLGACILFPLSIFSIFYALGLYERYHGWAIAGPILLPPLIGLYGIWARIPHAKHRADVTSAAFWGAMLVLTIAPFPLSYLDAQTYPDREPERTAEFRRLTPDSTLRDYFAFEGRRRNDWFEAVRRVKSRQTDAEILLKEGLLKREPPIQELSTNLWALGLEATPSLCEAFHEQLRDLAAKIDPISLSRGFGNNAIYDVWLRLRTIEWLVGAHCDLSDTLADIETKLRAVHKSPYDFQVTHILDTVATLR